MTVVFGTFQRRLNNSVNILQRWSRLDDAWAGLGFASKICLFYCVVCLLACHPRGHEVPEGSCEEMYVTTINNNLP